MTYLAEILMLFMGQYGLVATTVYHVIVFILIMITSTEQSHQEPYVPKCKRLPRRAWIQSTFLVINLLRQQLENHITNLKVTRKHRLGHRPFTYNAQKRYQQHKIRPWVSQTTHSVCFMSNRTKESHRNTPDINFDSDSAPIMLDVGASASITNNYNDFMLRPRHIRRNGKGIAGSVQAMLKDTIWWQLEDDHGQTHKFVIPNTYYIATAPTRMHHQQ